MTSEAASTSVMPAKLVPACFKPGAGIQGVYRNATSQPQRVYLLSDGRSVMHRHKRILVWVDGGEAKWNALKESIRLARWTRGRVTAIAVVPSYEGDLNLVGVKDVKGAIMGSGEEILSGAVERAESLEMQIKVVCEQGESHRKLLECAKASGHDLIVLGVSRDVSFLRLLIADAVSKVAAASRCDVLVIPEGASINWENLLFLTDESERGSGVGDDAIDMAASYGASLTVAGLGRSRLRCLAEKPSAGGDATPSPLQEHLRDIQAKAESAGVQCESLPMKGCDCSVLATLSNEHRGGMIVLGPRGRAGLKGLLTGRNIERIAQCSSRPVLVLGRHREVVRQ